MLRKAGKSLINQLGYTLIPYKNGFKDQMELITKYKSLVFQNKQNTTIFDVGAYIGKTVSKYRSLFSQGIVYAFEPYPNSFVGLNQKFRNDSSVYLVPKAVANEVGEKVFYVNQFKPTNSLLKRPSLGRRYYASNAETIEEIKVSVATIDEFCKEREILEIDILKMDIQGGELMALHGAQKTLSKNLIHLIYTEVMFVPHYENSATFNQISDFLSNYNYTLYDIYNCVHAKNGQLRYADALFVSSTIRNQVINLFDPEP